MKAASRFLMTGGLFIALAATSLSGEKPSRPRRAAAKEHAADTAAIRQAGQSFVKAYVAGDAKGLAAHWTENGEYVAEDGTTIRGRAEIEKAYGELFQKKKGKAEAEIEITSIRFPSRDTAIEEGHFKVRKGKDAPVSSKFSALCVREEGKWLMAVVREWPGAGASLRDLAWLIGTWEGRRGDATVRAAFEWWGKKTFIRGTIRLEQKDRTIEGLQMITEDGSTGELRSWTFDPDGSFTEAAWSQDGRKWVQDCSGVLDDGSILNATNILTRIDDDTFTFQSGDRTVNGEEVEDIPPVRLTRSARK